MGHRLSLFFSPSSPDPFTQTTAAARKTLNPRSSGIMEGISPFRWAGSMRKGLSSECEAGSVTLGGQFGVKKHLQHS